MTESQLRQMFQNNSDCYADTGVVEKDGSYTEGNVVQAMTEDKFIEVLKNADMVTVDPPRIIDYNQPAIHSKWGEIKIGDNIKWGGQYFGGYNEDGSAKKTIYKHGVNKVVSIFIEFDYLSMKLDNKKEFIINNIIDKNDRYGNWEKVD